MNKLLICVFILYGLLSSNVSSAIERPNILLIIADDLGVDALKGYDVGTVLPETPNIDKLRESGVSFTNAWACPVCAPTRASMLTGKYGVNSGINTIPGILTTDQKSIFKEIDELTNNAYSISVVGKWHNSRPNDIDHPLSHGADDFMGLIGAGVDDYFSWEKVENHEISNCTEYTTSYFTDYAANWINQQTKPWFMWFAHVAPHTPFHIPPAELYTSKNVNTNQQKFFAMIEAMDYEIGRLLDSIPPNVLDNTVIMFVGDNGTAGNILQGFPIGKGKNTVYQGGINVPLIVSGKGVMRINEKENAMINVSDFYATIAQIAQPDAFPTNMVNDSYSFKHLLSSSNEPKRSYNYMELGASQTVENDVYTIRNAEYKIIYNVDGVKEFYNLILDPFELNNLLVNELSPELINIKLDLEQQIKLINGMSFDAEEQQDTTELPYSTNKYTIVDTGIEDFYDNSSIISAPSIGEDFYGQDAGYKGNQPSYTNNNDGTISDNVTGLMWEQDMGEKISYDAAFEKAANSTLGGYTDWRVPTIKELYSLILFTGIVKGETAKIPFIDTDYFNQPLGNIAVGEREIDAQTWSATEYVGKTMNANATVFGVNFIDGRIKGYPKIKPQSGAANTMYFRMVRSNENYGINNFVDNEDGTISDLATGLMWQTADDGVARNWEEALAYSEALVLGGNTDWRLPNAKELQSIVDYTRSPQTSNSAAIDPLFTCTEINDPDGNSGQYPFYWTGTTHLDGINPYSGAAYVAFGEGQGKINDNLMDVHGAGCQRSDPKSGNKAEYPQFWGPQGDVRYDYNYVRCVRDISTVTSIKDIFNNDVKIYPNPVSNVLTIKGNSAITKVEITNLSGSILLSLFSNEKAFDINFNNFTEGLYFVNIYFNQNRTKIVKKIMKFK